jgi:hypothetical protein
MTTDLTEFKDDIAFERYVLDRATPLLPRPRTSLRCNKNRSHGTARPRLIAQHRPRLLTGIETSHPLYPHGSPAGS